MDYIKLILAGALGGIVVLLGSQVLGSSTNFGATTARTTITNPWLFQQPLNASSTLQVTGATNLYGILTQGGGIFASSTTATVGTIQDSYFDTENVIDFTPNVADVTLTLAASTSASYPTVAGQVRTIWIRNATTSATTGVILAAGTGTTLKTSTSTLTSVKITGDTDGYNYARLDFLRKANTDITAFVTLFKD